MMNITFSVNNVSPAWAFDKLRQSGYIIETTPPADVEKIYRDMIAGKWLLNGDAIIIDEHGKIIDGFKRLHACVLAKSSFSTVVVENVDRANKLTIGTHRPRRNSDFLKIKGVRNHALTSKVINALPSLTTGTYIQRNAVKPSAALAIQERYSAALASAAEFAVGKDWTEDNYVVALFHFLLSRIDAIKSEAFLLKAFERSDTKANDGTDPAIVLYAQQIRAETLSYTYKRIERFALIVKAWNAYYRSERVAQLKWGSGQNEPFPQIAGWATNIDVSDDTIAPDLFAAAEADDSELEISLELIDAATAAEYLDLNRLNNRNLVSSTVSKYAKDISSGNWQLNGQSIKFDRDGNLFDGQHRLSGCVQSGIPFQSLVVRNVDGAAFTTYDNRATKSFSDHLADNDIKYAKHLQSLVGRALKWDNGVFHSSVEPSIVEMNDYLTANESLKDFISSPTAALIRTPEKRDGARLFKAAPATLALWIFTRINSARATEFFEKLILGNLDPSRDAAINFLRNFQISSIDARRKELTTGRKAEHQELTALIRTWDAWIGNYDLKKTDLQLKDGEKVPAPLMTDF